MTRRRALISGAVLALALLIVGIAGATGSSPAPTAIALSGAYGPQDFNAMTTAAAPQAWPSGWQVNEQGTAAAANGLYALGTGSSTTGDTYSFGSSGAADRALGTLRSGTNVPYVGVEFTNTTGSAITALDVAYTGEQWRLGTAGRADELDLQYSLDATDPFGGTWAAAPASLTFVSPVTAGTTGALDGNANSRALAGTIPGLAIPAGATFWLRWFDVDASGADDGLAIDDVSVTPHTGAVNQPVAATCGSNITTTSGAAVQQQVSASDPDGTIGSIALDSVTPASSAISVSNFTAGTPATATLNVAATAAQGTYTVVVRATNTDPAPQSATCTLTVTVNASPTVIPIGSVQGSVPDTGDPTAFQSPLKGQKVTVQGVVTELTHEGNNNGFFLQNTTATADNDPNSSDGVFVFMGTFTTLIGGYKPVVGDEIKLTGTVNEFQGQTELGSASAAAVGTATVAPFDANPPADPTDAQRYWERHEGMLASAPTNSVVDSPTHFYSSTGDTEFYALNPASSLATRANPYAQRVYRGTAHPLSGSAGELILITDEGIKAADPNARLTPVHTYQRFTAAVSGGVYYDFGKYSVSASSQPQVGGGVDPSQDDAPPTFDRSQAYSIANFNMENLYDFRDDPTDGCDFDGNSGCPGVTPPFDYTPASDAEYQGRETEIAHQIVTDLHSPDVIVVQEAEDQDVCSVTNGAMDCGAALDNPDGQPDVLEELALHIQAAGGPVYSTAFDRNGADARGIICAFMYRSDRVSLIPADPNDPVLGSHPQVQYRGAALPYDNDVSNPKALNAVLPSDVDTSTGVDGSNVFTRAVQVAHFRIAPTTAAGSPSDIWVQANHFTSNPDASVGQRKEQAAYNAAVVKAIQSGDANAKVMVAGDLNVYPLTESDQLQALADAGLRDLYDTVLANDPASAYSYSFTGMAQDLDHQFVTQSFFDDLNTVNEAHINSDWTRVPGSNRGTSDHDPMVSQWKLKLDTPPTVDAGGPYTVDEGGTAALSATADDADGDAVTYAWDLDGNGTFETPGQSVSLPAPDGPATLDVAVQATDAFGLSSVDHATVTVNDVPPTAQFSASGSVTAGDSATLSLTNPFDPSAADVAAGFEYAFDCGSGYGAFSSAGTATCPAAQRGTLDVGGKIRDKDGGVREYRGSVTVNGRSPVVSAGGPYAVDEGGTVTLTATGSDPDGDAITYAWNLDGDATYETNGQSVTFHAGDGPATVTVSVLATDSTGATATTSTTVTVRNVAPTATFNAPATATAGVPFTISLTEPHDYDTALQYAFDCGDGTGFGPFGSATSATCSTASAGPLTVRGEVQDKDGGVTVYTKTVAVGVTFDAVCAIARQFASSTPDVEQLCDALGRAADAADKKHAVQEAAALAGAVADVAKGVLRGTWTPREAAQLVALIAKL